MQNRFDIRCVTEEEFDRYCLETPDFDFYCYSESDKGWVGCVRRGGSIKAITSPKAYRKEEDCILWIERQALKK